MPTTGGSKALDGFETRRDAFMVKKLRDAGAVIIGKTNLHELAYGITTISSMGGQTRNPYDPTRNPGGSSGGTGAAVAASFAAAGMGTDTCGSIRIPSSSNNLFGLRGTQGLSSRDGIVPLVAHAGHRRAARAHRHRSRDHARRDGRLRSGRSHDPQRAADTSRAPISQSLGDASLRRHDDRHPDAAVWHARPKTRKSAASCATRSGISRARRRRRRRRRFRASTICCRARA